MTDGGVKTRTPEHVARVAAANRGKTRTHEQCARMSGARRTGSELRNPALSYSAVHKRLRKDRGTPSLCDHCGTTTAKKFEWAYAGPGHDSGTAAYSVDLDDYIRLCTSCHMRLDRQRG